MTVAELIEALQRLPKSAMTAQVWYPCIVTNDEDGDPVESEMAVAETVQYERGSVVIE